MASPRKPAADPHWSAYRLADGRFDPLSPTGAMLVGGRWNSPGFGVVYASRNFAGAMLECLAHAGGGRLPRTYVSIELHIPADLPIETLAEPVLPRGWDATDLSVARRVGDNWLAAARSAVLLVPSVVARKESNVLLNPRHRDFGRIVAGRAEPVIWDARLFKRRR